MNLAVQETDLAVLAAYMIGVVAFGLWIGRGRQDLANYLLGGRNLPWWTVLGSIVATETSTATFLSIPGIAYGKNGDLRFLQLALGFIVGRIVIVYVLLPLYFRGQLYTAYQILDARFGGVTKQVASLVFVITRNLADGLRLFLTAIVLEKVVGISLATSIIVLGVATIVYTFAGGMKSVVWNDCIQFVVYVGGGILAGMILLQKIPGGWDQLAAYAFEHDKFRLFDFRLDVTEAFTFWAGLLGGMFLTMGSHGTDQMMVQRYLCARSERGASVALTLSGVVVLAQFTLFLMLGVALACFYDLHPPPTPFESNDRVFATFIVQELPRGIGLVGVILAAVFSAAMSTLSSSLNSSATAVVNDIYAPAMRGTVSSDHLVKVSRLMTVVFGIIQIAIGIVAARLSQSVVNDALAIAGFTAGGLLGIFALGVLTRRVGQVSALSGLVVGLAVMLVVKFWTPIAWPWFAIIGACATFAAGLTHSLAFPGPVRSQTSLPPAKEKS